MLELRQRSRSSGSVSGNYHAVDTDDELDSVPLLGLRGVKAIPKANSTVCVKIGFFFSLWGVVFLSSIAMMLYLETPSIYVKLNVEGAEKKKGFVASIVYAIMMYLGCMLISGYLWYSASNLKEYRDDDLRLLD